MFFGAANVARTILTEDSDGTLPRLLTTPTRRHHPRRQVQSRCSHRHGAGGRAADRGTRAVRHRLGQPRRRRLLTIAAAAVASGLALLIISLVKTPGQAGAIGAGVYLVLALVGGNFTGTATVGTAYATLRSSRPTAGSSAAGTRSCGAAALTDIRWRRAGTAGLRRRSSSSSPWRAFGGGTREAASFLARKDLLETRRDRLSFLFILVMPLPFTTVLRTALRRRQQTACRWPCATRDGGAAGGAARRRAGQVGRRAVVRKQRGRLRAVDGRRARRRRPAHPGRLLRCGGGGEPARLTIVSTAGSTGGMAASSEVRAAAPALVAAELAARVGAAEAVGPRTFPAGAEDTVLSQVPARAHVPLPRKPWPTRPCRSPRSSRPAPPPARCPAASCSARPA